MTYDLRDDYLAEGYGAEETAEFDRLSTIEAIEQALQGLGHTTDRIGQAKSLVKRLAAGERWDMVFNIAEGLHGFGREALVPALLDTYGIPYTFSDPLVLSLTLHKGMTKRVIRDLCIPTPDFAIVETIDDLSLVDLPFPLFAKPIAEGTGKGIAADSKIQTKAELDRVCRRILTQFQQPVLIETFLPGREFTVGIVGTGKEAAAVGCMEVLLRQNAEHEVYSYLNKAKYEEVVDYRLVDDAAAREAIEVALAAWRGLGCKDGGRIDLRADSHGHPCFIEVNPLAGLHPQHSDLCILCTLAGITYQELIMRIMQSAMKRLESAPLLTCCAEMAGAMPKPLSA